MACSCPNGEGEEIKSVTMRRRCCAGQMGRVRMYVKRGGGESMLVGGRRWQYIVCTPRRRDRQLQKGHTRVTTAGQASGTDVCPPQVCGLLGE